MLETPVPARILLFLGSFLLSLAAMLPMRVAIDYTELVHRGLSAREATGSIYGGNLVDARLGPVLLGDLAVGIHPLSLIAGRVDMSFQGAGGETQIDGVASLTRHSFEVKRLNGSLDIGAALHPLPMRAVELSNVELRFIGNKCSTASGMVTARVNAGELAAPVSGALAGNARCDGDTLLLPLASQNGLAHVDLRITPSRHVSGRMLIQNSDDSLAQPLQALGFRPTNRGYALEIDRAY